MVAPATPYDPTYETEEDWIVQKYTLLATGNILRYAAKDVRKDRTGVHANVAISLNWITLGWSTFNIEKDEDRVRLANSAYKHLDKETNALDMAEFPAQVFKHALDLFCIGLWDEHVGSNLGGWLAGDPNVPAAMRLLSSYILQDAGTILYAPPGKGKSYTAVGMAMSLQHGIDSVWPLADTRTPLYINLERSERSMSARLSLVATALGIDPTAGLYMLNKRGSSLADIYESAKRTIATNKCDVVFLDSISRSGAGSMNADDVANRIMDMLNALCPTWFAIGHSPRGDESHVYGSQMFDGACDVAIQLQSQLSGDKGSTGVRLRVSKANDIPEGFTSTHVLEWFPDPIKGLSGIRASRKGEFAALEANRKIGIEEACRMFAESATGGLITANGVATEFDLNRSNVATYLSQSEEWQVMKRGGNNLALYGMRSNREEPTKLYD